MVAAERDTLSPTNSEQDEKFITVCQGSIQLVSIDNLAIDKELKLGTQVAVFVIYILFDAGELCFQILKALPRSISCYLYIFLTIGESAKMKGNL